MLSVRALKEILKTVPDDAKITRCSYEADSVIVIYSKNGRKSWTIAADGSVIKAVS